MRVKPGVFGLLRYPENVPDEVEEGAAGSADAAVAENEDVAGEAPVEEKPKKPAPTTDQPSQV